MGRKRIDMTGQKFGRLTVIKFSLISNNGGACWLCKCDCGNEIIVNGHNLRREATKSCGCLQKEKIRETANKQKLPYGIASRNRVLAAHKHSAKRRNLDQDLTDEQIFALHKQNCHYCGSPPSNAHVTKSSNGLYIYNGIDRMNNDIGYTIDNSVSCCWECNKLKGPRGHDEFLNHIKAVYLHLNSQNG